MGSLQNDTFSFSGLQSVVIPNTVTSIGNRAFYFCQGLKQIALPNSLISIGSAAFSRCTSFQSSLYIPASVTKIVNNPFEYCHFESIVVDEGNQYYDSRDNCNAIITKAYNSIKTGCDNTVIPNSVSEIAPYAFEGYHGSMKKLHIPASVYIRRPSEFWGCTNLESITVDENNPYYDTRDNCNALILTQTNELIAGSNNSIIPESVTAIGTKAFYSRRDLQHINLHEGITAIGDSAFSHCSLDEIILPNTLTSLGNGAFEYCEPAKKIVIGNQLEAISKNAFRWCSNVETLNIPESVKRIEEAAFGMCGSIKYLNLGNSVEFIGESAFGINKFQVTSLIIPNSVKEIGEWAFSGFKVKIISIGNNVEKIGESAFSGLCDVMVSLSKMPPIVDDRGVYGPRVKLLYVPEQSKALYEAADVWRDFANIVALPAEATDVKPDVSELQMAVGDDHTLSVKVEPAEAIQTVAFSSDNPEVATVDGDGLITAVSDGEATISTYAIDGSGIVAQCKVKVGNAGVENVTTDAEAVEVARYDLYGRRLTEPTVGINIVVMSDGSARKELVK